MTTYKIYDRNTYLLTINIPSYLTNSEKLSYAAKILGIYDSTSPGLSTAPEEKDSKVKVFSRNISSLHNPLLLIEQP